MKEMIEMEKALKKLGVKTSMSTSSERTKVQMIVYLAQGLFGFKLGIDDYRWFVTELTEGDKND